MTGASTPQKTKTGRIFAIIGVMLLLGSIGPVPDFVEEVEAQGGEGDEGLVITKSDYLEEVDEVFGIEAFAYLVLEDSSFSVPEARGVASVKITSEEDSGGVEMDLLETGIGTGVFKGGFGFIDGESEGANDHPLYGKIGFDGDEATQTAIIKVDPEITAGQEITVSITGGPTKTFQWFPAENADLQVDGVGANPMVFDEVDTNYTITVTDADLAYGKNAELTHIVRVFSESDQQGRTVELEEDSGLFKGVISFTKSSGSEEQLQVQNGDSIYFQYVEPYTKKGKSQIHTFPGDGAVFQEGTDSTIFVDRDEYYGVTDPANHHGSDRAVIFVTDTAETDLDGVRAGKLLVGVTSNADPGPGIMVDATQLMKASSQYIATVGFTTGDSDASKGLIKVNGGGDEITVTYGGGDVKFDWLPVDDAAITISKGGSVDRLVGTGTATVRLIDPDSVGKGTVSVSLKSDSNPTSGFSLGLVEFAPGKFQGHFSIGSGSQSLQLSDGDWLAVEYDDAFTSDGSQQIVRSKLIQWLEDEPPEGGAAASDIDSIRFLEADQETEIAEASKGQTVYLEISSEHHEGEGEIGFDLQAIDCDESITVTLTEGADGVFTGPISFAQLDDCSLGKVVDDGGEIYLPFERIIAKGEDNEILASLLWHPSGAEQIKVLENAFGGGNFTVEMSSLDSQSLWVVDGSTEAAGREYDFSHIPGSERVYVGEIKTVTVDDGDSIENITVAGLVGGGKHRLADCGGIVSIELHWEIEGGAPIIGDPGDEGTEEGDCNEVSLTETEDEWLVEFGVLDCPDDADCELVIEYLTRVELGDCDSDGGYERTNSGIELCDSPAGEVQVDYASTTITIHGVASSDEDSATLEFVDGTGVPVFVGEVPTWFSSSSNPKDVLFFYEGVNRPKNTDHFRSTFANAQWRPAETGEIRFRSHAFDGAAPSPFYGPGIPVEVRDIDASDPSRFDTIQVAWNNTNDSGVAVLRETGSHTGVFRGILDLDGVGNADTVHVDYTDRYDSEGVERTVNSTLEWKPSEDGAITICSDAACKDEMAESDNFQGISDRFFIKVEDEDRVHEDELTVQVSSDSDVLGEEITLNRQGSGENAFFISGEVRFETTNKAGNNRVFVEGDAEELITITYRDQIDFGGELFVESESINWLPVHDGFVRFDREYHVGTSSSGDAAWEVGGLERLARATITLTDPDLSVVKTAVNVIDVSDGGFGEGGEITLSSGGHVVDGFTLVETGLNTGIFIATIGFESTCPPDPALPCLEVVNNDLLTLEYKDPNPATNPDNQAEAFWYEEGRGVVSFDQTGYPGLDAGPRVTLFDEDLTVDHINVTLTSDRDSEGITLKLLSANHPGGGGDPGVFTEQISLSTSASSTDARRLQLFNDRVETIRVEYEDDDPAGIRSDTAIIGAGEPPVTTLVTSPVSPNENGWFTTAVDFTFETDRPVEQIQETIYKVNGELQEPFVPGNSARQLPGSGPIYEFEFRSIPVVGESEDWKEHTIKVSLEAPDEVVEDLDATSKPNGAVELEWGLVEGKQGPPALSYAVFRGMPGDDLGDAVLAGNATSEQFTDIPPAGDDPPQLGEEFTYFVRVVNEAGQSGPRSLTIDALSDRVAPSLESFDVDADELREEDNEDTISATLTVTDDPDNLEDIEEVFMRVIDPFGEQLEEVDMESVDSTTWSLDYDGFEECGVYTLLGIASDAVGNEGRLNHSVRYVAIDVEAPRVVDLTQEVEQGQDVNVTVRDNCAGIESVSYSIDGGDSRDVTIPARGSSESCEPGPCEVSFQIPADRLMEGENRITFTLSDANETANEAVVTMTVLVKIPEETAAAPDVTTPPSIGEGSSLVEFGGRFSFTMSGGTPTSLTFEVDGLVDERSILNGLNAATGLVRVDVGELEAGPHEAIVRAGNPSGNDRQTFSFYVLESGIPLPPGNVWVEKDENGRPVVNWDASPSDASKVGGYIVHRAASPWVVIGVTDANTFSYTDLTALGSKNYQYAVTAFGPNGEGSLEPGADSEESLPWFQGVQATSFQTDEIDEGIPTYIWWGLLVVLAVLVVVSLVYVNRQAIFGRKPEHLYAQDTVQEEYPDEAAESSTPFGEERHMIRCPNCSDEFHVSGERPIVTDCPNCGRKGILR